jgi:hypothetical protein
LSLSHRDGVVEIAYPNRIHDYARAAAFVQQGIIDVAPGAADDWRMRFAAVAGEFPDEVKMFFSRLNNNPPPFSAPDPPSLSISSPLVSCVIVLNENLPFVCEQLLPSLIENSRAHPIEIIIVCNGSVDYAQNLPNVVGLRAEWGAVSKSYNAGARVSRGEFLAFFHDDCVVCDPLWIEKCLQRLKAGAHAVAGEYRVIGKVGGVDVPRLPVAKCVPLVIRKSDFEAAGRFDEYHYIGYEDLDFTLALASRGMKLVATDMHIRHFNGMSSTLKYNPVPGLRELYALGALPRQAILRRFREFWGSGLVVDGVNYTRFCSDVQLLYVLGKYRGYLAGLHENAYVNAETALMHALPPDVAADPESLLARFRLLDREQSGATSELP